MKKLLSLVLAVTLVLGLGVFALADDNGNELGYDPSSPAAFGFDINGYGYDDDDGDDNDYYNNGENDDNYGNGYNNDDNYTDDDNDDYIDNNDDDDYNQHPVPDWNEIFGLEEGEHVEVVVSEEILSIPVYGGFPVEAGWQIFNPRTRTWQGPFNWATSQATINNDRANIIEWNTPSIHIRWVQPRLEANAHIQGTQSMNTGLAVAPPASTAVTAAQMTMLARYTGPARIDQATPISHTAFGTWMPTGTVPNGNQTTVNANQGGAVAWSPGPVPPAGTPTSWNWTAPTNPSITGTPTATHPQSANWPGATNATTQPPPAPGSAAGTGTTLHIGDWGAPWASGSTAFVSPMVTWFNDAFYTPATGAVLAAFADDFGPFATLPRLSPGSPDSWITGIDGAQTPCSLGRLGYLRAQTSTAAAPNRYCWVDESWRHCCRERIPHHGGN